MKSSIWVIPTVVIIVGVAGTLITCVPPVSQPVIRVSPLSAGVEFSGVDEQTCSSRDSPLASTVLSSESEYSGSLVYNDRNPMHPFSVHLYLFS